MCCKICFITKTCYKTLCETSYCYVISAPLNVDIQCFDINGVEFTDCMVPEYIGTLVVTLTNTLAVDVM